MTSSYEKPANDLEWVRERLMSIGRSGWPPIAEASGVPLQTLTKVAYGHVQDPRFSTVRGLYMTIQARPEWRGYNGGYGPRRKAKASR